MSTLNPIYLIIFSTLLNKFVKKTNMNKNSLKLHNKLGHMRRKLEGVRVLQKEVQWLHRHLRVMSYKIWNTRIVKAFPLWILRGKRKVGKRERESANNRHPGNTLLDCKSKKCSTFRNCFLDLVGNGKFRQL
jgi:hypothetical protein